MSRIPRSPKSKVATVARLEIAQRRTDVLRLRLQGHLLSDIVVAISAKYGLPKYNQGAASKDIQVSLRSLNEEQKYAAEEYQRYELELMHWIQSKASTRAATGDPESLRVMLAASDRRCKLLGLDSPTLIKVESEIERELDWLINGLKSRLPQEDFSRILETIEQLESERIAR